MPFIIHLKSLGEIWGSKLSTVSQLPRGSLHSVVKLVPAVKLTAVMTGTGGGARSTIEHAWPRIITDFLLISAISTSLAAQIKHH